MHVTYNLQLVILDRYISVGCGRVIIINSNQHYVADGRTECAINEDVDTSLGKHLSLISEEHAESVHDEVRSSVSQQFHDSDEHHVQSTIVEDVPDIGRSRATATSLTEELPDTGRSSKAGEDVRTKSLSEFEGGPDAGSSSKSLSSVAEEVKSGSVVESVEKTPDSRSQKEYSDDDSVAMEISSDAQ